MVKIVLQNYFEVYNPTYSRYTYITEEVDDKFASYEVLTKRFRDAVNDDEFKNWIEDNEVAIDFEEIFTCVRYVDEEGNNFGLSGPLHIRFMKFKTDEDKVLFHLRWG